jgi:hypothetical protein
VWVRFWDAGNTIGSIVLTPALARRLPVTGLELTQEPTNGSSASFHVEDCSHTVRPAVRTSFYPRDLFSDRWPPTRPLPGVPAQPHRKWHAAHPHTHTNAQNTKSKAQILRLRYTRFNMQGRPFGESFNVSLFPFRVAAPASAFCKSCILTGPRDLGSSHVPMKRVSA